MFELGLELRSSGGHLREFPGRVDSRLCRLCPSRRRLYLPGIVRLAQVSLRLLPPGEEPERLLQPWGPLQEPCVLPRPGSPEESVLHLAALGVSASVDLGEDEPDRAEPLAAQVPGHSLGLRELDRAVAVAEVVEARVPGAEPPLRDDLALALDDVVDEGEVDPQVVEVAQGSLHPKARVAVLVARLVDEVAEEPVPLAVDRSAGAKGRIEPRGICQKRRIVFGEEVVGEVEVAGGRLGRGVGLEEAPVGGVVLPGSQVVEAGVLIEILARVAKRVCVRLVGCRGAGVETVSVGVIAIGADVGSVVIG